MKSLKVVSLLFYMLISFNLVLAFFSLWSLQRMMPVIDRIYERNVRSVDACDDMLIALNMDPVDQKVLKEALKIIGNNITETGEQDLYIRLSRKIDSLLQGNEENRKEVVQLIATLAGENRKAVIREIQQTRHLRQAGAWSIVFFSLAFFSLCLFLEKRMRKNLAGVLEEISDVLASRKAGDPYRRCRAADLPPDMQSLCSNVNEILDQNDQRK